VLADGPKGAVAKAHIAALALGVLAAPTLAEAKPSVEPTVDRDSGRLSIELDGKAILAESGRGGSGPGGRVGFQTARRWYHATRLLERRGDGRHQRLVLSTDDPFGRTIALEARADGRGVSQIDARVSGGRLAEVLAMGVGFLAHGSERYLGFGERSNAVDQRGGTVENYVGEGPFLPGEYAIPRATVPPWGFRERVDATYFPMPWLLSTRGVGVLANNRETSRFRLGSEVAHEWSVEVDARRLSLSVFPGPKPAAALRRLTDRVGRQPQAAAPWVFGPWFQTGHANREPDELTYVDILRRADAPISAVETHMRYMPCGADQGAEAAERARTQAFHAAGLAALTYTREAICQTYSSVFAPAAAAGAFVRRPDGGPYTFQAFVGTGVTQVGMLDFSSPEGERAYASILDRAYANGYDGWMEDYGEYVPPDSLAANGMTGAELHNYYPVLYHGAGMRYARKKERPLIRFTRSGWTGVHPHTQVVWGGDPTTGWGFDGLRSALTEALTMGLSGISTWGSDIGGFFTFSEQRLTDELLARWIQFGAVSGVMRTKAEGIGVPKEARPQIWEQPALPIWRRYAKLRTQLYPLLVAADRKYRRTGLPIMRHLALAYPADRRAVARDDEFLFADSLLAAPVVEPGQLMRELYLPEGRWVDLWRSVAYRQEDGGLELGKARILRGKRELTIPAPLEELPLLIKAGALLPLLPSEVDTLADYGEGSPGLTRWRDRRDQLEVLAFPRGHTRQRFYGDGRLISREGHGLWRLRIESARDLAVALQASFSALKRGFRPQTVTADGRALRSWSFDRRTDVLRVNLPIGTSELIVR
jgi:alpha-glucosidase